MNVTDSFFQQKPDIKPIIYADEQRAKEEWKGPDNPYAALPKMVMLAYKIPESIQAIAKQGEFDEFDLNVFFSAKGEGEDAKFVYEDYVQKWLNLIRGSYLEVAPEGWVKADGIGRLDETMVVVRAVGDSMEPKIHDGDLCVVRKIGAVNYDNRIVLVQRNDKAVDPESGGAYLLKKLVKKGGKVLLRSLNGDYRDIETTSSDDLKIVAEFKSVLRA